MASEVAGWAYTEIAALLQDIGTFSTLQEAMQAVQRSPYHYLDFVKYKTRNGAEYVAGAVRTVTGGAASPVSSATETALEVARGADLTATAEKVKTMGIGFGERSLPGGTKEYYPRALLGVDLGIAGAVLAPFAGVALGADLYTQNPDLWTKISQRLLPFCYEEGTEIPGWAEIAEDIWRVSLPKLAFDAIKSLFDEEGIGGNTEGGHISGTTSGVGSLNYQSIGDGSPAPSSYFPQAYWSVPEGSFVCAGDGYNFVAASETPQVVMLKTAPGSTSYITSRNLVRSYTQNGLTVYYDAVINVPLPNSNYPGLVSSTTFDGHSTGQIAWDLVYGEKIPDGNYPVGTSPYGGNTYPSPPSSSPAVTDIPQAGTAPSTAPMIPVSLPIPAPKTSPVPTPDPEEQPDPAMTEAPEEQVDPYVLPLPEPEEETDPTIQPTIPIDEDPSQPEIPPGRIIDIIPPISPPEGITPFPSLPTTPAWFDSDVGMVTVYHPTPQQLYAFSRWLWVTLSEASIETVWNNPFDGVITAFELYCTPTDNGHRNIHSGFLDSGIDSATISRYTEINCGTLGIPEYYGNYFDYSPYSKAHIYLPFIGIQELNVDDIVGHAVNVTYRIDEYNGTCIAMITVAKVTIVDGEEVEYSNTMYQYSGNCSVELPLSGGSQAQIKAGLMMADATRQAALISAGAELIGGIGSLLGGSIGGAIGSIGDAISTVAQGEVSALGHMLSGKSTVQKSGSFGSSHGALGIKTPFIVVTRPKQVKVANYNELYGYPAHKMVTIGSCEGFIRCREVHVISPTATDDEKTLIEQLLKAGVYLSE